MTVDLPGQGLLPAEGKVFRPDMYVPMKAVVDYAVNRKDVDPEKLAAYGYSGGGGFVPQAAMHDNRISNYSALCKKPAKISACNYSSVLQMFTSRLFSYTYGMLNSLIVGR